LLQLIYLKQAAVAQRQRSGSNAANSIAPNSFIAANQFEASSGSAATQLIQLHPIHLLQLIDLKQAAVAQRSDAANSIARNSFIAANRFEARSGSAATRTVQYHPIHLLQLIDFKQAAVAQRQRSSLIAPNSFPAYQFEATSRSAAAATQPIQLQTIHLLQLIYLKQPAIAQ
jgi:hypothetical protein